MLYVFVLIHIGLSHDTITRIGTYQTIGACVAEAKAYKAKDIDDTKLCIERSRND